MLALALLHTFFQHSADRWPDHIALDVPPSEHSERRQFSYATLRARAHALSCALAKFVHEESVVAILLPRTSEHLYVAQLAALGAGAAYTAIDPAFPDEQLKQILDDANAVALLTDAAGEVRARAVGFDPARIIVAAAVPPVSMQPAAPAWLTSESLAYLIYTSGTTGRPKGVMIEHRSIVNLMASDMHEFALTPDDRVAQGSSPSYDSALEETWLAWSAGAAVVVMSDETARLGPDLVPWLHRERISVLCPPPTLLRTTGCDDPETALPNLRILYVGGEALPRDLADRWSRGRRLVNGYGPTECTVTSVRTDITANSAITIGRPVPGIHAHVVDAELNDVADGTQGELCLSGIALARGYRHLADLTAQKFPHHALHGRIYRTGDLVHRDEDGNLHYHGRIDAQVKLRGYRIELEAIEARLADCAGVREAACHVQGDGVQQMLVAFVVPTSVESPPAFAALKAELQRTLPVYMVPQRFGLIAALPTTVGGKCDRKHLPVLTAEPADEARSILSARNPVEGAILAAFQSVLTGRGAISVHDDFFAELMGDSLSAAMVISKLRDDPATESITVRDLYASRSAAALATNVHGRTAPTSARVEQIARIPGRPVLVTCLQGLWLLLGLILVSSLSYLLTFVLLPMLYDHLGALPLLLLSPLIFIVGMVAYTAAAALLLIAAKRALIGRYVPTRAPVWGSFFLRNWIVQSTAMLVPWRALDGTIFLQYILRGLGARIGARVHIQRGVMLTQGGWDLLEIGDDVAVGREVALRLVDFDHGEIMVGVIKLGARSSLDTRAGMDAGTSLGAHAHVTALSSVATGTHAGDNQCWSGVPATMVGEAPMGAALGEDARAASPLRFSILLLLARGAVLAALALPLELLVIGAALALGISAEQAMTWLTADGLNATMLFSVALMAVLAVPITLITEVALMHAVGRVKPGVIGCWSPAYVRVLLKSELLESAGDWLSGTLFWPVWLRAAGMRVGAGCEISTIIDVAPELVEIGPACFLADGIYLGGARVRNGTVTLANVRLGTNTFLGNHVVIPAGQDLPNDFLLGVSTVADDRAVSAGSGWFGHPPFALPRREVVALDRSLTHEPSRLRYWNRVMWEAGRIALPIVPTIAVVLWLEAVLAAQSRFSTSMLLFVVVPLLNLLPILFFALLILTMKWCLLGRVQPGQHALWSCWCSRWDFLYVAWGIYTRAGLSALEGTLFLNAYLRLVGMRIGKRVVLGRGFAQVVDPDMLNFEDDATVSALFQAHTFEDRVLKIDHVHIRRGATVGSGAVLLYGADIGANARVASHSVVMKRERLLPNRQYAGCPTQEG